MGVAASGRASARLLEWQSRQVRRVVNEGFMGIKGWRMRSRSLGEKMALNGGIHALHEAVTGGGRGGRLRRPRREDGVAGGEGPDGGLLEKHTVGLRPQGVHTGGVQPGITR